MYEVVRLILVSTPVSVKAERVQVYLTLTLLDSHVLLDKVNDINLGRNVSPLQSVIQVEGPQEVLVEDVVFSQD